MPDHPLSTALLSLDAIAEDPTRASALPFEVARALWGRCLLVQVALLPAIADPPSPPPMAAPVEPEAWLSQEEVCRRYGLDAPWLVRHRRALRARQIVSRVSRKRVIYNARRLARYIEQCAR